MIFFKNFSVTVKFIHFQNLSKSREEYLGSVDALRVFSGLPGSSHARYTVPPPTCSKGSPGGGGGWKRYNTHFAKAGSAWPCACFRSTPFLGVLMKVEGIRCGSASPGLR